MTTDELTTKRASRLRTNPKTRRRGPQTRRRGPKPQISDAVGSLPLISKVDHLKQSCSWPSQLQIIRLSEGSESTHTTTKGLKIYCVRSATDLNVGNTSPVIVDQRRFSSTHAHSSRTLVLPQGPHVHAHISPDLE